MQNMTSRSEKTFAGIISVCFAIWSAAFIFGSSFIAVDGKRYFCLFDDAMISMRYAWNLSHGNGLVWNPGEYVQGYTNLLMTLLMSFATMVFDKSSAILFIQIAGMSFMLATAYATMRIADHFVRDENCQYRGLIKIMAFICPLLYYPLAYWALMGMETGLLTMLCLMGVLFALDYTKTQKAGLVYFAAVCFGLAYLTRNDSIIFAAPTWLYIAWNSPQSKAGSRNIPQLFLAAGLYVLFIAGQGIFQYAYYGELLPNTYTLKLTGMPFAERIRNGIGFVEPFLMEVSLVLAVSALYLIARFRKRNLLLISFILAAMAYQVYVGGDAWSYWRMLSPSMPFLLVLFICGIVFLVSVLLDLATVKAFLGRHPGLQGKHIPEASIILLILAGLLSVDARFLPEILFKTKPLQVATNQKNVNTAIAINQLTTRGATVGVFWAGAIPYFTERKAFDFLGKCDRHIAHLPPDLSGKISWNGMNSVPGHNKYDLNYSIRTLKPTYVQWFKWGSQDLAEFARSNYMMINYYDSSKVYLLKDSPAVLWDEIRRLSE
jgi:arabinofuranosyltransferase